MNNLFLDPVIVEKLSYLDLFTQQIEYIEGLLEYYFKQQAATILKRTDYSDRYSRLIVKSFRTK